MKKQWNLGELIRAVGSVPADYPVVFKDGKAFASIGAYRGSNDDLAISAKKDVTVTADEVLVRLARVLNEEVGENEILMTGETLLWRSQYGEMEQKAIVGAKVKSGVLIIKTKKREWDY
jgi:hypothetical protein